MKDREVYLRKLIQFKNKPLIKVITGIRRCGKSTLLALFENHLINNGINKDHIIRINFESFQFEHISDYKEMYGYINDKILDPKENYYLLLDEVQMISSWEKVVNSFFVDTNVDIYITGSNAYLLSSELSTLLSGRYIEIKMQPLSFKEYLIQQRIEKPADISNREKVIHHLEIYLKNGGFPETIGTDRLTSKTILVDLYNDILSRDIVSRFDADLDIVKKIGYYLMTNISDPFSCIPYSIGIKELVIKIETATCLVGKTHGHLQKCGFACTGPAFQQDPIPLFNVKIEMR